VQKLINFETCLKCIGNCINIKYKILKAFITVYQKELTYLKMNNTCAFVFYENLVLIPSNYFSTNNNVF